MLTHWNKLINTDCVVVGIGDQKIYPIFRNGSSSLINSANKKYVNNKIKKLDNILLINPQTSSVNYNDDFNNNYKNSLNYVLRTCVRGMR